MQRLAQIAPTEFLVPERYSIDPRGRYQSHWRALVRPRNVSEVQEVARYANSKKIPIVAYGGGTGLVGGQCFPDKRGAICLSLENLNQIEIEADNVLVGAGAILDQLHEALQNSPRHFPMHLASSGSAQIGGLISTNAGGVNVVRWGSMGKLVRGVQAVFADGRIIDGTSELRKDNTGYQVDRLMIGAEGTLGIITSARLNTFRRDEMKAVLLSPIASPKAALDLFYELQLLTAEISAFELISGEGLKFRLDAGFETAPIGCPDWSALIELGGSQHSVDDALVKLANLLPDAVLSQNEKQSSKLWHIRETIPLANRHIGAIASHDISLPMHLVPMFLTDMNAILKQQQIRINAFGHLGDGNLHYNLFPSEGRKKASYNADELSNIVYQKVVDMQGSISAEHGIGRHKAAMMDTYGLGEKRDLMRDLKRAYDPNNILNPGVFFSEM